MHNTPRSLTMGNDFHDIFENPLITL